MFLTALQQQAESGQGKRLHCMANQLAAGSKNDKVSWLCLVEYHRQTVKALFADSGGGNTDSRALC